MKDNPFQALETAIIIVGIIQIITLIVFFVMANNVAKIRKKLYDPPKNVSIQDYMNAADIEAYIDNKDAAIENYLRAKYLMEKDFKYNSQYDNLYNNMILKEIENDMAEIDNKIKDLKNKMT